MLRMVDDTRFYDSARPRPREGVTAFGPSADASPAVVEVARRRHHRAAVEPRHCRGVQPQPARCCDRAPVLGGEVRFVRVRVHAARTARPARRLRDHAVVLADLAHEGDDQLEAIGGHFFVFRIALGTVGYRSALLIVIVGPYTHTEIEGVAIGGLSFFIASALVVGDQRVPGPALAPAVGVAIAAGAARAARGDRGAVRDSHGHVPALHRRLRVERRDRARGDPDRDPQLVPRAAACRRHVAGDDGSDTPHRLRSALRSARSTSVSTR